MNFTYTGDIELTLEGRLCEVNGSITGYYEDAEAPNQPEWCSVSIDLEHGIIWTYDDYEEMNESQLEYAKQFIEAEIYLEKELTR